MTPQPAPLLACHMSLPISQQTSAQHCTHCTTPQLLLIDIEDLLGPELPIPAFDAIMHCLLATPKLLTFRPPLRPIRMINNHTDLP